MTSLADVLVLGSPVLLTTIGTDGPRSRPVLLQQDPWQERSTLAVLTSAGARKVAEVRRAPRVCLAAMGPDGFTELEADAEIVEDQQVVSRAMARFLGRAEEPPESDGSADGEYGEGSSAGAGSLVMIRLRVTSGRSWTVRSPAPFDHEMVDLEV